MPETQKETDALVESINTARKETLQSYTEGLRNVVGAPAEKVWEEGIHSAEDFIKQTFKAQNEVSMALLERVRGLANMPDEAVEVVSQLEDINKTVYAAQQEVINACLEVVKALEPAKAANSARALVNLPISKLKAAVMRVVEINMQLLSGVSKELEEPKRTTSRKTSAKSSAKEE